MTSRSVLAAVALLLVFAACGDDAGSPLFTQAPTTTAATTATTAAATTTTTAASTTTAGATTTSTSSSTTTTVAETTTTTIDPGDFVFPDIDLSTVEAIAPTEPAEGLDAYLGAGPDEALGTAFTAAVADAGVDLIGMSISVWPVSETGTYLLVLDFDDTAVALGEDDAAQQTLFNTLLEHPLIDAAPIGRLVINYSSVGEDGVAFVFTATVAMEDMKGYQSGTELAEDAVLFQVVREGE